MVNREKIEKLITQIELKTNAELVPVFLKKSDDYFHINLILGILFLSITSLSIYYFQELSIEWLLFGQFSSLLIGILLGNIACFKRALLSNDKIKQETYQKAFEFFYTLKLHETSDRSAVLCFVSLLEHQIIILADSGINSKVPPSFWDQEVREFVEFAKTKDLDQASEILLKKIGEVLIKNFPKTSSDQNEIINKVYIE